MDPLPELTPCFVHPNIYKLEIDSASLNELLQLFCLDILRGCTFSNVETFLVEYVTSIIEPVGWKAVWRSTKESSAFKFECDFIVEVINVSLEKLEADVYVRSVIIENSDLSILETLKTKINPENLLTVPLIELFTISENDEEELYAKTATCIEHVRLFMTQLARPWDGDDDDISYTEKILKPRLQLFFDMKNNILPKPVITKIQLILKEGWKIYKDLDALYTEMNISDSEAEINDDDLMHSMSLRTRLGELQAKLEMLENPIIRSLVMKKYVPRKSFKSQMSSKAGPVTFIIAKEFTFEVIKNLDLGPTTVLEFEHNPESAFKCCSSGDRILIFPGVYQCDNLGWLEGDVSIYGVGACTDIVLEATGNSDVFLNSCAQNLRVENLTIKAKSGLLCALLVHHGTLSLKDCIIECNKSDIGILLLGGSSATVENSIVCNAAKDGIQLRSLSTLCLKSSKILQCERHGLQIDVEDGNSSSNFTDVEVFDSQITENRGHGLFLNNAPISEICLQRPDGDFSVLKLFPWLKHKIENSVTEGNLQAGIGVSSACKSHNSVTRLTSRLYPSIPKDEEHNCSVLSDILNEVSMVDLNTAKYYDSVFD
ncbi:SHC SH2 domain-binding protein 1-like [Uloborus diversus]|uniref:SHC SH2 domain-binding protein 1-like n=1 Tax=Uloborus diversus TaxID=327109 RepID=UPI002409C889|nr:SHC SH2 domain-binding protein 1-like [Uloborus diversus]